jgi:hypothetical protein
MFERFLNPGRVLKGGMPDIDCDLATKCCSNFRPDEEYKKKFFSSEVSLIPDDKIRDFWKEYIELRDKVNDTRRHDIFVQSKKYKEFDKPIFDVPEDSIVAKDK